MKNPSARVGRARVGSAKVGNPTSKFGFRISPAIDLSSYRKVQSSLIKWDSDVPAGTSIKVEISLDNGQTWLEATNNDAIPSIKHGDDLFGKSLLVKQTLFSESDLVTPTISKLELYINKIAILLEKPKSYIFGYTNDGYLVGATYSNENSDYIPLVSNSKLPINKDVHVAFSEKDGVRRLYIDGELDAEDTFESGIWANSEKVYIGRMVDGSIRDIRLWNVERTGKEIYDNRFIRINPSNPDLASYWELKDGSGDVVLDSTLNKNDGVIIGNPEWVESGRLMINRNESGTYYTSATWSKFWEIDTEDKERKSIKLSGVLEKPEGTDVLYRIKTAIDTEALADTEWSEWFELDEWVDEIPSNNVVQVELKVTSDGNATPNIDSITLSESLAWDRGGTWDSPIVAHAEYEHPVIDIGQVLSTLVLQRMEVINPSNASIKTYFRYSEDNIKWSEYKEFVPEILKLRYFQFKIVIDADPNQARPEITRLSYAMMIEDRIEHGVFVDVSANGTSIKFSSAFNSVPSVNANPIGAEFLIPVIRSITEEEFVIELYDISGSAKHGKISWQAVGT